MKLTFVAIEKLKEAGEHDPAAYYTLAPRSALLNLCGEGWRRTSVEVEDDDGKPMFLLSRKPDPAPAPEPKKRRGLLGRLKETT